MRIRTFITLSFLIAGAFLGSVYLIENPGTLSIEWLDYKIHISIAFFLFAVTAVLLCTVFIITILQKIISYPKKLRLQYLQRKEEKSLKYITLSLSAIANNEPSIAKKYAEKCTKNKKLTPLKTFLLAQASFLSHDNLESKKLHTELLDFTETRLYALKRLIQLSIENKDEAKATQLLEQARQFSPKSQWIYSQNLELLVKTQQWDNAIQMIHTSLRKKMLSQEVGFKALSGIYCQLCLDALKKGFMEKAFSMATNSLKFTRKYVQRNTPFPAIFIIYSHLLIQDKQPKKALKIIFEGWKSSPHPDLISQLYEIKKLLPKLSTIKMIKKLTQTNPNHTESFIALVQIYIDEGLWGKARMVAQNARDNGCQESRLFMLLAKIEKSEFPERDTIFLCEQWLQKARQGSLSSWLCKNCGAYHEKWQIMCEHCYSFQHIVWQSTRPTINQKELQNIEFLQSL